MKFKDQYNFVKQNIKKNKTRLFMTVLATAMGCSFLIVLASAGIGIKQSIVDRIVGDRLVTEISIHGKTDEEGRFMHNEMYDADLAFFKSLPNVKAVLYRNYISEPFNPSIDGEAVPANNFINLDFEEERKAGYKLSAGKLPEQGKLEAVIGFHIREDQSQGAQLLTEIAPAKEWIGKTVKLEVPAGGSDTGKTEKLEIIIVGVAAESTKEWQRDHTMYLGSDILQRVEAITGKTYGSLSREAVREEGEEPQPQARQAERSYDSVRVITTHMKHVQGLADQIQEEGYYNHSIVSELKKVNMMFLIMTIGLIFVGTIAVLIASIGIFNTMTMAVTERAQDIGIMKAIGAHPSVIRKVFLFESALIGVIGALIGTIVSYLISITVNASLPVLIESLMNEQVPADFKFSVIPPYLTLLACAISIGVAVLSGSRPAGRAVKIDVLSALRRDI